MSQDKPSAQPDNEHQPPTDEAAESLRIELALARAAAADAWRGYVEAGALTHRQQAALLTGRNHDLEAQRFLATERERKAVEEIDRLDGLNHEQRRQIQELGEALEQEKARRLYPTIKRLIKRALLSVGITVNPERHVPQATASPEEDSGKVEPAVGEAALSVSEDQALSPSASGSDLPILLVTPYAKSDPASRFTLDLLDGLRTRHNVYVWHMGADDLLSELHDAAGAVVTSRESRHDLNCAREIAAKLVNELGSFAFAIALGKESRNALPALAEQRVPVLALLHEPDAYGTSIYTYQEIFFWASHSCFTTPEALQYAKRICAYLRPSAASALLPGPGARSMPRFTDNSPYSAALEHRLGLNSATPPDAVIVGWGPVSFDAGVDLFIATARHLNALNAGKRYHYVWLAQADDAVREPSFPLAIDRQIQQMGLQNHVSILYDPASEAFPASLATIALLTLRQDTPRHTAVEALKLGLPAVTFAGTSSVAGFLQDHGLESSCVVEPYDTKAMAAAAAELLNDARAHERVAGQLKALDYTPLEFDNYVDKLLELAQRTRDIANQEELDEALINEKGAPDAGYMGEIVHGADTLTLSPSRLYLRAWKAGTGARKPRPGLLPSIYAQMHVPAESLEDPYAHFLRHGSPAGPWEYPVIAPNDSDLLPVESPRVALHIHAYYPEMLGEIITRLQRNRTRPDLFISVKDDHCASVAKAATERYEGRTCAIEVVPNRGRDVGPFLTTFGPGLIAEYDIIGHLHTKQSSHADQTVVSMWRDFLMENLVSGDNSGRMLDNIVCQMTRNPHWGIVFPDDPVPLGWDSNLACAQTLAKRMAPGKTLPTHFSFPAGTMFWVRAEALRPFVALGLQYNDYPIEPLPIDGTMLHALERLFGVMPRLLDMECAVTSVPGVSR